MSENVNDRLTQAMHGQPQTNIDERHQYLGSLRERIYLRLTVKEAEDKSAVQVFLKHFADYQQYQVLINGKIAQTALMQQVVAASVKANTHFAVINDESAKDGEADTGLLVVSTTAINEDAITLTDKYHLATATNTDPTNEQKPERHSLFGKLFGDSKGE